MDMASIFLKAGAGLNPGGQRRPGGKRLFTDRHQCPSINEDFYVWQGGRQI
jgi:hypothetical protein